MLLLHLAQPTQPQLIRCGSQHAVLLDMFDQSFMMTSGTAAALQVTKGPTAPARA
jgi:hypothetical protein